MGSPGVKGDMGKPGPVVSGVQCSFVAREVMSIKDLSWNFPTAIINRSCDPVHVFK